MSAPLHMIAVETYRSQRVRAPASGAMVSAFKIGYSTVGRAVLLALYGSRALDVTSKHVSYHYVSLEGDVSAHNGHLLLALTENEFERVKQITRVHPSRRTGIFWWHENQWWHFPHTGESEFSLAVNRTGPSIDPTRYRVVSPISGEKISTVEGIRDEYSQRSPDQPGWWWLHGQTYEHRELLKLKGCRWSQKRKAWYFQGTTLPEAIQHLVNATPAVAPLALTPTLTAVIEQALIDDDAAEVRARVSLTPPQTLLPPAPAHRFTLGQTVYLATNVRVTVDQKLRMDTPGTIIRRYVYKKTPDFRHAFAYDLDFGTHGVHSVFQDNLDHQPQNLRGIERDETVMLMFGASADKAFLANIERRQRIPQDYQVLDEINTNAAIPVGPSGDSDQEALALADVSASAEIIETAPPESTIRVLPPPILTDDTTDLIAVAVRTTSREARQTASAIMTSNRDKRLWIEQAAVGELTGSITGNVWCYGYALHGGVLLYLNMGGPRMALEAIRAKLSKGDVVSLVPPDAPAIELSAGETEGKPNTGQYTAYLNTMSEAKFTSAILVHAALQPTYRHAFTGVFRTSDAQATAKVHHLVQALVTIPVFALWADYLMDAGQRAGLIRPSFPRGGGIDLLIVERDAKAWTRLVTGGLANGVIALPQMAVK